MMCDMLFVASSHSLSVSIYSLDNRCKQLSNSERAEIKEMIDPKNRSATKISEVIHSFGVPIIYILFAIFPDLIYFFMFIFFKKWVHDGILILILFI